jgi:hypothetical protein
MSISNLDLYCFNFTTVNHLHIVFIDGNPHHFFHWSIDAVYKLTLSIYLLLLVGKHVFVLSSYVTHACPLLFIGPLIISNQTKNPSLVFVCLLQSTMSRLAVTVNSGFVFLCCFTIVLPLMSDAFQCYVYDSGKSWMIKQSYVYFFGFRQSPGADNDR